MLHTKIQAVGHDITIKLEGRLAGASVQQLGELWKRVRVARLHEGMRVDLTAVTFIDDEGKRLLQSIQESGAQFVADGGLTKDILDDVVGAIL